MEFPQKVMLLCQDLTKMKNKIAEIAVSISKNGSFDIIDNLDNNYILRFDLNSKLAKKKFGFEAKINLKEGMLLMKNKMFIPC